MNGEKILVAVTGTNIEPACIMSAYKIGKRYPNADLEVVFGYGIAEARNIAVDKALNGGYQYLLFVDRDIVIPNNAPEVMLAGMKATGAPVVSGWYMSAFQNGTVSVAKYLSDRRYYEVMSREEWEKHSADYVLSDANGLGLALIDTSIFAKMPYPYFRFVMYENHSCLSEDLYLFDYMRRNNIPHYCCRYLRAQHIKSVWL